MSKSNILTVGSVAYDGIITPYDQRDRVLGGSATHFALAAQHFAPIDLVAVVGDDFAYADENLLKDKGIDLTGLEKVEGKCFYWKGEYLENWNDRVTHDTQLNCFEHFSPKIPDNYRHNEFVFLGNIHPALQLQVLNQMEGKPRIVALDTMNLWIDISKDDLINTLSKVDFLIVNDSEAEMLTGKKGLVEAAREIEKLGPSTVCIKKGEHGAMIIQGQNIFMVPAYPLCKVVDPTGAGDSFAGGLIGYLAALGDLSFENLKTAVVYGSVMGSFAVESFSVDKVASLTKSDIDKRYQEFVQMTHFHQ